MTNWFIITSAFAICSYPTFAQPKPTIRDTYTRSSAKLTSLTKMAPNATSFLGHNEGVPGIYYPVPFKELGFYSRLTQNPPIRKSQLDTKMHLLYKILLLKFEGIERFIQVDEGLSRIVLSDIEGEIERIGNLLDSYHDIKGDILYLDDYCALHGKWMRYNFVYSSNLIERRIFFKNLKIGTTNMTDFMKELIKLKNTNTELLAYASYALLYQRFFDQYGGINCTSYTKLHVQILKEFVIFVITDSFENYSILTERFDKLIMTLVLEEFPYKSFDIIKRYSYFMITDKFLINFIDEICRNHCNQIQVVNLFLLIDKFPVGNASIAAILHLYSIIKGNQYEWALHILYVHSVIERQKSNLSFKFVETNMRKSFLDVEKMISNWTESFIHSLASKILELGKKGEYMNAMNSMLRTDISHINYPISLEISQLDKLVKFLYNVIPERVNEICQVINEYFTKYKLFMYGKLLDILLDNDNVHQMDIFRVAHQIRTHPDEEYFAPLKAKLPSDIRNLLWNKECVVKNIAYNDYLFPSELYFINTEQSNSVVEYPRNAMAGTYNSSSVKFKWYFMYDHISNSFLIKEMVHGSYLSVRGKRFGDQTYHLQFLENSSENYVTKWKIHFVKSKQNISDNIIFQLTSSINEPLKYLYAASQILDSSSRSVFMSPLKRSSSDSFWSLICMNSNKEDVQGKGKNELTYLPYTGKKLPEEAEREIEQDFFEHDNNMLSFLERLNLKGLVEVDKSNLSIHHLISDFSRISMKFLGIQLLELIEFSSYSKKLAGDFDKLYKIVLIEQIKAAGSGIILVYRYLLNNVTSINEENNVEQFDLCSEALEYLTKYRCYLDIGDNISKFSGSQLHLRLFETIRINNFSLSRSNFSDYVMYIENKNVCLSRLHAFKNNTVNNNFGSGTEKTILIDLTTDAVLNFKFHAGVIYFRLFKNESMVFDIFDKIIFDHQSAYEAVYNYYVVFISHLLYTRDLHSSVTAMYVSYSYDKVNTSSLLTEPLRATYSFMVQIILQNPSYNHTLSDSLKLKLENILTERKRHLIELLRLVAKRTMNTGQLLWLVNQIMTYYPAEISQTIYVIFKQRHEIDFNFQQVSAFIRYYPAELRKKAFDDVIKQIISNGRPNKTNTEAIKFAEYIYGNFDQYIPCFHTGCIKDLHSVLPSYEKTYVESKLCDLWSTKYLVSLFVSKTYFINLIEGEKNISLIPEIRNYKGFNFNWIFEYVKQRDTFLLKSRVGNLYMTLGKRLGNSENYKLTFSTNKYKNPLEWILELRKNKQHFANGFTLRPAQVNISHLYLSPFKSGTKSNSITVQLSKPNYDSNADHGDIYGHAEIWAVRCL